MGDIQENTDDKHLLQQYMSFIYNSSLQYIHSTAAAIFCVCFNVSYQNSVWTITVG